MTKSNALINKAEMWQNVVFWVEPNRITLEGT